MSRMVIETLDKYGGMTRQAISNYVDRRGTDDGLSAMIKDYPSRGGKMIRPSLCLATARALGASPKSALSTAAAIELLHNGMLIHDDIQDDSEQRRGEPALHIRHGIPQAINAGDALLSLGLRPLMDNVKTIGPRLALRIVAETERMAWETVEGQALELKWRRENNFDLSIADYQVMVVKKTAWLGMIYPTRVGALIASRGKTNPDRFLAFGAFFGIAFQIKDDIANLQGTPTYGKERAGDIYEGKRTLMLIHCYQHSNAVEQARLKEIYRLDRLKRGTPEISWIESLMDRYGSHEHAFNIATVMAAHALHEFDKAFGSVSDSPDKAFIHELVLWLMSKD